MQKLHNFTHLLEVYFSTRLYTTEEIEREVQQENCFFDEKELNLERTNIVEKIASRIDWGNEVLAEAAIDGDVSFEIETTLCQEEQFECRGSATWTEVDSVGCKDRPIGRSKKCYATFKALKGHPVELDIAAPELGWSTEYEFDF